MSTADEVGLTAQQDARATAAIARLKRIAKVEDRFPRVSTRPATEDALLTVSVHVHDGPNGHGRTIFAERRRGNLLIRRTEGDGPHGTTSDGWRVIDLSKV